MTAKMNYPAAELTGYPTESSSVNHSSSHQDARYSGSRINSLTFWKLPTPHILSKKIEK